MSSTAQCRLRLFLPASIALLCFLLLPESAAFAQVPSETPHDTSHTAPYTAHTVEARTLADCLHLNLLPNAPKIGLVLTGGGARGFAQIGVLKVFEKNHIPIHFIVGTSIGAMVGGLYASGYTADELDSIARTTDWDQILALGDENYRRELYNDQKQESDRSLLTVQLDQWLPVIPDAASEGKRLSAFINKLVWNALYHAPQSFDDLKYPFRALSTDIVTGKLITFNRGNLADILRASATAPLRFAPVTKDSLILVDGGLLSNIPVDAAKAAGCDIIIVVNSTDSLLGSTELNTPWNIADQVVTILMRQQYAKELSEASIVITPQLGEHRTYEFNAIDSLIAAGEIAAEQKAGVIRDSIAQAARRIGISATQENATQGENKNGGLIQGAQVVLNTRSGNKAESPLEKMSDSILQHLIGKPYSVKAYLPVFENLLRFFRAKGLSYATIAKTEFDATAGTLSMYIDDGIVQAINIEGNTRTDQNVILRELDVQIGKPFTADAAERSLSNLNSLQLFRQVSLEAIPHATGDKTGVEARIRVVESSPWLARLSGKVDNERNTQLGVQIADDNLFGKGVEASGLIFGGLRNRTLELTLSSRRVLTSYFSYNFTAYSRLRNIYVYRDSQISTNSVDANVNGEYSQLQNGGEFSIGENVPRFGDLSLHARYEWQYLTNLSGSGLSGADKVAALSGQFHLDTQDQFPFPTSGALILAQYETALKTLGANITYTKLEVSYDSYVSYNFVSTFHPKIHWGFEDETTPTADQFRIGGQYNFLGLREDEYLGNQVFIAGLEYRYRLPFRIYFDTYIKAEYDIGTVWPEISQIHFGDLRHGVGVSLAFDTPIGIADFAVGKSFYLANPIQARPFAESYPTFVYFTIGRGL